MSQFGFRSTPRLASSLATLLVSMAGLVGCTAGVMPTGSPGKAGSTGTGSGGSFTGGGGTVMIVGTGGSTSGSAGAGGTLPVPPGCGDGINNQGGIEQCDDGNTIAGDGCNGACHVE